MGCPVHIWAPAMAAIVPFARVARDRLYDIRAARRAARGTAAAPAPQVHRWAPVQPQGRPPAE